MSTWIKGAKILLVDDNRVNLMLAKAALADFEPKVQLAGSGMEALQLVRMDAFDIIFMDLLMPEMDGIETVAKLSGEKIGLPPIVALTGKENENIRDLKSHGFVDFIKKPAKKEDFERVLTQYLKKERKKQ